MTYNITDFPVKAFQFCLIPYQLVLFYYWVWEKQHYLIVYIVILLNMLGDSTVFILSRSPVICGVVEFFSALGQEFRSNTRQGLAAQYLNVLKGSNLDCGAYVPLTNTNKDETPVW